MKKYFSNKIVLISAIVLLVLTSLFFLFRSISGAENKLQPVSSEYAEFVAAVTSGIISVEAPIKVILVNPYKGDSAKKQEILDDIFSFSPDIDGFARWENDYTVEFVPSQRLKPGTVYEARFKLDRVADVPSGLSILTFSFQTLAPDFNLSYEHLRTYGSEPGFYYFQGFVQTADVEDNQKLESIITVVDSKQKKYPVKWKHNSDQKIHHFIIDSIERSDNPEKLYIEYDGDAINVDKKGKTEISIPAIGNFSVLDVFQHNDSSQYFSVYFSDPLNSEQNLTGLISLDELNIKLSADGNLVKVFPSQTIAKQMVELAISEAIENYNSKKLGARFAKKFGVSDIKPAVELLGNGTILPNSDSLILPFKAVNLKAVDVTITKIYSNNIGQFLQQNRLSDDYDLRQVARPIARQRINLQNSGITNLSRWHVFSVDLSKLMKPDMGAIYRVTLSFKKSYSIYECDKKSENYNEEAITDEYTQIENEEISIDGNESYYYYDEEDYENYWENRDNPCHIAYYNNSKKRSRNLFASNFGIIGKCSDQNELTVIVTKITDAKPEGGISVEVFDYQHQLLGTSSTDGDGFCTIKCPRKPFLVVAKKDKEFGYLALKEGQSLSLSMFDIKGQETQKGIKGFIYGERGVWRPGDSIFISFIMSDPHKQFPKGHPVIFDLYNPKGQLFKKQVKVQHVNGFYTFHTATPENAPTGNWNLSVSAGGAHFNKILKIETIKPNRLSIDMSLGKDSILRGDLKGTLSAKWLHGAIASNMKVNVNMGLTKTATSFAKFPDFIFDDQSVSFSPQEQVIFEGNLNSEGTTNFSYNIEADKSAPGMLKLGLVTKVFEEGGNFSIDFYTTKYSPFDYYVGLNFSLVHGSYGYLYTDTTQKIKVASVDYKGKAIARKGIKYELIRVDWNWWWDSSDEDLASYINSSRSTLVKSGYISTGNDGYGTFNLRVDGAQRGSHYIRLTDSEGHQSGKRVYFYNPWYRDYESNNDHPEAAAMLVVSSEKEKYQPGEKARISFPANTKTRALISIESGSKIIEKFWAEVKPADNRASVEFEVTEEMAPNVYVNVMLLQPYTQTGNDMPLRMYGYAPFLVENPATHLYPQIQSPKKVGSEEKLDIAVSEKNGRAMTYTLALVDEGLLNITRYHAPDPWNTFYAREALGVNTWDIYNFIFGGVAGKIEHLFAIGGDMEGLADKGDKTKNRFTPVVEFLGPFVLKKGSENKHSIQLPKYAGAVRAMVVAADNLAFGCAEKTTIVKNPLMIVATLPRVLGPGEEVELPVTLFADDEEMDNINLEVKTNAMFTVIGESKKVVSAKKTGGKDAFFRLKVKNAIGTASVKVFASSGKFKADYEIELLVRNANEKELRLSDEVIEKGKKMNTKIDWFGMTGTNKATLEVSICPPLDLSRRLAYLIHYPYGCIEQTTSSVFPQLFLNDVIELSDKEKTDIENNIKAGIEKLKLFQNSEGAFTYWPGSNSVSDWACTYAGNFVLEAEKKGFNLPQGMKESWLQYQRKQARNWPYNDTYLSHLTQAYRLMALAMAGSPETGAMNRLKESSTMPDQAKWMLAQAYFHAGQKEVAKTMILNLGLDFKKYRETGYTYGSDVRDLSLVLPVLSGLKEYEKAFPIVDQLAKVLSSREWLSTQETAFALMGISNFIAFSGKFEDGISCSLSLNGKTQNYRSKQKVFKWEITDNIQNINLENTGKTVLYARLVTEGVPSAGEESEINSNLNLSVDYYDLKGRSVDISNMKQGTDFKAVVKVTNPGTIYGDFQNLALSQVFPSGWEIVNTRLADMDNTSNASKPDYIDVRDDRVYTFFGLRAKNTEVFEVLLNASYAGKFYMPSLQCEAMYDNNIKARKKGLWVEVGQ